MRTPKAPVVQTSAMSELLDSLTVVTGSGIPIPAMRAEVMSVARKALEMHAATEAALAAAHAENERLRGELRYIQEGVVPMLSQHIRQALAPANGGEEENHAPITR